MSKEHFDLLSCGISRIGEGRRPVPETALRAQQTIDEKFRDGDVTAPERVQLRFLISEVIRMNARQRQ